MNIIAMITWNIVKPMLGLRASYIDEKRRSSIGISTELFINLPISM
ncbi:hypothetical protein [Vulcanisaeta distributa]|nr:hypothetical protein [Vulcanisaeta distributa]